jgi:hypothetical protein
MMLIFYHLLIYFAAYIETRKKAFDMLGNFGNKGIVTIKDLIGSTGNNEATLAVL